MYSKTQSHGGNLSIKKVAAGLLILVLLLWFAMNCNVTNSTMNAPNVYEKGLALSAVQNKQTALVTGGLGFIGSHVCEELLSRDFQVFVYDDESNGHNFNAKTLNLKGDIRVISDFRQLNSITTQIDYVVHLAAAISVAESMTMPEKYNKYVKNGSKCCKSDTTQHSRTNIAGSAKVFFW